MSLLLFFAGLGNGGGDDGGEDGTLSTRVASEINCDCSAELEDETGIGLKKAKIEPRLTGSAGAAAGSLGS